jgi:hypothetical protein
MTLNTSHRIGLLAILAVLMALTRVNHFGSSLMLPDASLAAFLLGGLLLQRSCGFAVLLAAAFGADVLSAQTATEAGWCMTPAYFGLIPTYATLWLAGRWLAKRELDFVRAGSVSVAAIAIAFVISNLTWFAFSGTTGGMRLADYSLAVAEYFPPYLGSAMLYLVPAWLGWKLFHGMAARRAENR